MGKPYKDDREDKDMDAETTATDPRSTSKQAGKGKGKRNRARGRKPGGEAIESKPDENLVMLGMLPIGLTRKRMNYRIKKGYEMVSPPLIFRDVVPYAAFFGGWSKKVGIDEECYSELAGNVSGLQGKDYFTRTELTKTNQTLYPTTIFNTELRDVVWPRYNALFQSGLRDTITVSSSQFFKIMGTTMKMFTAVYQLYLLHTYAFEMAKKDHLEEGEKIILSWVNQSGLMSARLRNQMTRIARELDSYPCFPNMVTEIRRQLTPFVDPKSPETIHVPLVPLIRETMSKDNPVTALRALMDSFDSDILTLAGSYPNQISLMKTYIPVTYLTVQAFSAGAIQPDPIRASGGYNSYPNTYNVSGNTTELLTPLGWSYPNSAISVENIESLHDLESADYAGSDFTHELLLRDSLESSPFFFTKFEEPIALEALAATIYFGDHDLAGDDHFSLVTPHVFGVIRLLDQPRSRIQPTDWVTIAGPSASYESITGRASDDMANEDLMHHLYFKFVAKVDGQTHMTKDHGYQECVLDLNSLIITVRLFAGHSFQIDGVVTLDEAQVGGRIRVRQPGIRDAYIK